jgi:hypothetical protein
LIQLNSSGSGFSAGTLTNPATPAEFDFRATVSGKISVLMYAEQQGMQSLLTGASGTTLSDGVFVASQLAGARDHLVQINNVVAGEELHLNAGVFYDPTKPFLVYPVGAYRLYISTESTDFSARAPHMIPLDRSGLGVQLGTIEAPGDADLFAFTASVTGRAFVRVDGAAISGQELRIDTVPGKTYGIMVSDAGNHTGPYVLTINSIADDFPDATVYTFDPSKTPTLSGTINYADDVDVFRFTATQSGVVTLKMQNQFGSDDVSTLRCALSVSGATVGYDVSPPRRSFDDDPANDRIVQFTVVKGRQYTIRASGADGSIGSYRLSLAWAVDDFSATAPHVISLDASGAATQTGRIDAPGDKDVFQFTAPVSGYVIVALMPEGSSRAGNPYTGPWAPGTNMQGLLTFSEPIVSGVVVPAFGPAYLGPLEAFSGAGWLETTRDHFAAIQVTAGQTYEFAVSADENTIGAYTVALATYNSDAVATFTTKSNGNPFPAPVHDLGVSGQRSLTFDFSKGPPSLTINEGYIAPVAETPPTTTDSTNTRLAAFTLPSTNTTTPPATVTVPSSQSTATSNSLFTTLLSVAARDNSVGPRDNTVAAGLGESDGASTLLTTLLVTFVLPGVNSHTAPGGDDPNADPLIRGTVFDDLDGDGQQAAHEPGVAGETVLLESRQGGRYVVVNTATTDARGAFAFPDVQPGDYRVRLVTEAGPGSAHTTPTSHTVKVFSDSKPRAFNFGKASKRGTTRNDRDQPSHCWVVDNVVPPLENAHFDEVDRVFRDWDEVGGTAPILEDVERDGPASDCWFCLLPPIAFLGIASTHRDIPAIERRPDTSRRQKT